MWFQLHEIPKVVKIMKTKSRKVVVECWGGRKGNWCSMGIESQSGKMRKLTRPVQQQCEYMLTLLNRTL